MNYKFPKKEHLTGQKTIEHLYRQGESFLIFPFRVVFFDVTESTEKVPVKVMFSVSKKRFKRAVDRNRIKRLMREAYRLNKNNINQYAFEQNKNIHVSFQYISKEKESYKFIYKRMGMALIKITKKIVERKKEV